MLGQSILTRASSSSANNRTFVYEVAGLRQTDQTDLTAYPVRNSGNLLIQVPYSRMNEEMQRISRLGGTIVSIRSAEEVAPKTAAPAADGE